jgi:hypothetical protein
MQWVGENFFAAARDRNPFIQSVVIQRTYWAISALLSHVLSCTELCMFLLSTGLEVWVLIWQQLTLLLSMTLIGIRTMTSKPSPELIELVRLIR